MDVRVGVGRSRILRAPSMAGHGTPRGSKRLLEYLSLDFEAEGHFTLEYV
jgi:hypothetical protein